MTTLCYINEYIYFQLQLGHFSYLYERQTGKLESSFCLNRNIKVREHYRENRPTWKKVKQKKIRDV